MVSDNIAVIADSAILPINLDIRRAYAKISSARLRPLNLNPEFTLLIHVLDSNHKLLTGTRTGVILLILKEMKMFCYNAWTRNPKFDADRGRTEWLS